MFLTKLNMAIIDKKYWPSHYGKLYYMIRSWFRPKSQPGGYRENWRICQTK